MVEKGVDPSTEQICLQAAAGGYWEQSVDYSLVSHCVFFFGSLSDTQQAVSETHQIPTRKSLKAIRKSIERLSISLESHLKSHLISDSKSV